MFDLLKVAALTLVPPTAIILGRNASNHQAIFSLASAEGALMVGTFGGGVLAYSAATLATTSGRSSPSYVAVSATSNTSVYAIRYLEEKSARLLAATTCYKAAGCVARQGPSINVISAGVLGAVGTLALPPGRMASALYPTPDGGLVVGLSTGFYGTAGGLVIFTAAALRSAQAPFFLNASGSLGETKAAVDSVWAVGGALLIATEQDGLVVRRCPFTADAAAPQ